MVVQTELAPREGLPPKGIAVRISLVPKVADARKVTKARMRADLKANGVPRVIVVPKVAAQRVNAAKGIVVLRETVVRRVRVVR